MAIALRRAGTPKPILEAITALYSETKFAVSYEGMLSEVREQKTGIRQGCTLSPFLFVIIMNVIMHDVMNKTRPKVQEFRIDCTSFHEILYADDTALTATQNKALNKLLNATEKESSYYGLKLHHGKCVHLSNCKVARVRYLDGSYMPRKEMVTYLGVTLTLPRNISKEIAQRTQATMGVARRMQIFWNKINASTTWKIRVMDSILKSRMLYAIEPTTLLVGHLKRIDSVQHKILRKILSVPSTFVDRQYSHEWLRTKAEQLLKDEGKEREIKSWSEDIKHRQINLLGHLIRADARDPMRLITFQHGILQPNIPGARRVGRPRIPWLNIVKEAAWGKISDEPFCNTEEQNTGLEDRALFREPPFGRG
jgi:hypothetical protein